MAKKAGKGPQDTDKPSKKSQDPRWGWRFELAEFLTNERENEAGLSRAQSIGSEIYKQQIESETTPRPPDLAFLIRLLMLFHRVKGHNLPRPRLRRLFILWILARLEYIFHDTESKKELEGLKKELHEDFRSKPDDPFTAEATNNQIFDYYWRTSGAEVRQRLHEALAPLSVESPLEGETTPPVINHLPTLAQFPEAFSPLLVVVGGYIGGRNRKPEHAAELFTRPQSFINLQYLLRLKLSEDTEIVSDRLLLDLKKDKERAEWLGRKHVLVIGSPTVNLFSRHLIRNKKLIFNFVFENSTYQLGTDFYDETIKKSDHVDITDLLDSSSAVKIFYRMMQKKGEIDINSPEFDLGRISVEDKNKIKSKVSEIRELAGMTEAGDEADSDDIIEKFVPTQYFSPLDLRLSHCADGQLEESAVISLGENIWSDLLPKEDRENRRYAILAVCGQNRFSTALALKALSHEYKDYEGGYTHRPLGGVLKIRRSELKGPKQVTDSEWHWLGKTYEAQKVLTMIDGARELFEKDPSVFFPLFKSWPEVEAYKEMVAQYTEKA